MGVEDVSLNNSNQNPATNRLINGFSRLSEVNLLLQITSIMDHELFTKAHGKTIEFISSSSSENCITIVFEDGFQIEIVGRGSDEGFYLEVRE